MLILIAHIPQTFTNDHKSVTPKRIRIHSWMLRDICVKLFEPDIL